MVQPLSSELLGILASEVELILKTSGNASLIWEKRWQTDIRALLDESDFSARTISRTKAPDFLDRRTRPIDRILSALLERNATIRKAFDNPEAAEYWEDFVPSLLKLFDLMEDLNEAQA